MTSIHEFIERWGATAVVTGIVTGLLTLLIVASWDGDELVRRTACGFALGVLLGLDIGILVEWQAHRRDSNH